MSKDMGHERKEVEYMVIQRKLFAYIREVGITQSSICRKTGISIDRMSALARNKTKLTADEFEAICLAIQKSPNDFMDGQ